MAGPIVIEPPHRQDLPGSTDPSALVVSAVETLRAAREVYAQRYAQNTDDVAQLGAMVAVSNALAALEAFRKEGAD